MRMLTILAILAAAVVLSVEAFGGSKYSYPTAYQREKAEENWRKAIEARVKTLEDELREVIALNKMLRTQRRREMQEVPTRTYGSVPTPTQRSTTGTYPAPARSPVYYGN